MAQGFFEITNNWTAQNFSAGQWSVKLQNTNATLLVSENSNGEVIFNSKDFNNGVIPLNVVAQKDYYFKVVGDVDNAKVFYSDAFFFRVKGGGGGTGGGGGNTLPSTITAQELQADFGGAFSVFPSKIFLGGISTQLQITGQTETPLILDKVVDDSLSIYDATTGIFDLTKVSQGGSPFVNFSSTMLLSTSSKGYLGDFSLILRPVGYNFSIGNPPNTLSFPDPTLVANGASTTTSLRSGYFATQLTISGLLPRAKYQLLAYRQSTSVNLRVEGTLAPCYVAISGI